MRDGYLALKWLVQANGSGMRCRWPCWMGHNGHEYGQKWLTSTIAGAGIIWEQNSPLKRHCLPRNGGPARTTSLPILGKRRLAVRQIS